MSKNIDAVTSEEVFDIIAVYFTNCYWNYIYNQALNEWREEKHKTVQIAYQNVVETYNKAFCTVSNRDENLNKHYIVIMKDLHAYYKKFMDSNETLIGFIDILSKHFTSAEEYKKLSYQDRRKDLIVRQIMNRTLTKFTMYIVKEEIPNIVNEKTRKDKNKVNRIKKKFSEIINQERNDFCSILLAKKTNVNVNREAATGIPKEICDKMESKIKDLINEKNDIVKERNKLIDYIQVLKSAITEKDQTIVILSEKVQQLESRRRKPAAATPSVIIQQPPGFERNNFRPDASTPGINNQYPVQYPAQNPYPNQTVANQQAVQQVISREPAKETEDEPDDTIVDNDEVDLVEVNELTPDD